MKHRAYRQHRFDKNPPQTGAVLIVVLWVATGLVTVVLLFGQSMMFYYRTAENSLAGIQSEQAIEGALRYICFVLENNEEPGRFPTEDTYTPEAIPIGDSNAWIIGRDTSTEQSVLPVYGIIDECAKLNLNTATAEMLENLPNMTPEFAAAIVDWRDEDDEVSESGAESDSYLLLNPSYECKNAVFESLFELNLVYNATYDLLFGEDANLNGILDPHENDGLTHLPQDDQNGTLMKGLLEYVTIYSREPNQDSEGEQRTNVNGDDDETLNELLSQTFDSERAEEIEQQLGGEDEFENLIEVYQNSEMTLEEFNQIANSITTTDDEFIHGRVNVNTAPVEVLMCIPGIDENEANNLISHRSGQATDNLASIAWITEVLDEESAAEAGSYLTTHTYQYRVDIAAVGQNGKGFRRFFFIVDLSEGEANVIYRRDLSEMGWALGETVLQELAYSKEQRG